MIFIDSSKDLVKERERRSTPSVIDTKDTCQLALVADHLFFEHMGQGKSSTAINYMVSVLVDTSIRNVTTRIDDNKHIDK